MNEHECMEKGSCYRHIDHDLVVSAWTISDRKRFASEFLCQSCWSFFTREEIIGFKHFSYPDPEIKNSSHISSADSGAES